MALVKLLRASAAAAGMLALVGMTHANAADIYAGGGGMKDVPPPVYPWAGFYIGGHMGIDWASVDTRANWYNWADGSGKIIGGTPFGGNSLSTTGGFGGAQLGYNWQSGNFVGGIELDLGGASLNDTPTWVGLGKYGSSVVGLKTDGGFYGDITGRLGYTWGPAMIYAKGGFAWLTFDHKAWGYDGGGVGYWNNGDGKNDTLTGWTVGGGIEWMVSPSWSIKVEYLHFDFSLDNSNYLLDGCNNWNFYKNDLTVDTVKLGFNYFFHPTYSPLK